MPDGTAALLTSDALLARPVERTTREEHQHVPQPHRRTGPRADGRHGRHGRHGLAAAVVTSGILVVGLASGSSAVLEPGTPAKDVTVGLDNDNAANPFIQPPGVTAKQHMDNTDVLFGRDNDDLLIGKLGGDTLLAGADDDILIGGPEKGQAPNSDVLVGDTGDDINIWAPGDGSDAFIGNEGKDTMIFAPFVENPDGSLLITRTLRTQDPAREDRRPAGVHLHGRAGAGVGAARRAVPGALQRQRQPGRHRPPEGRREGLLPEPGGRQGRRRRLTGADPPRSAPCPWTGSRGTVGAILAPAS